MVSWDEQAESKKKATGQGAESKHQTGWETHLLSKGILTIPEEVPATFRLDLHFVRSWSSLKCKAFLVVSLLEAAAPKMPKAGAMRQAQRVTGPPARQARGAGWKALLSTQLRSWLLPGKQHLGCALLSLFLR